MARSARPIVLFHNTSKPLLQQVQPAALHLDCIARNMARAPTGYTKTLGEMTDGERLQVSMRRIAAEKVAVDLKR